MSVRTHTCPALDAVGSSLGTCEVFSAIEKFARIYGHSFTCQLSKNHGLIFLL